MTPQRQYFPSQRSQCRHRAVGRIVPARAGVAAAAVVGLAAFVALASGSGPPPDLPQDAEPRFYNPQGGGMGRCVPGEVVVLFKEGASDEARNQAATRVSGSLRARDARARTRIVNVPVDRNPYEVAAALKADPAVARAFPNAVGQFDALPSDPELPKWWFYEAPPPSCCFDYTPCESSACNTRIGGIRLDAYWNEYADLSDNQVNQVIAVVFDSGLDFRHSEFEWAVNLPNRSQTPRIYLFPSFVTNPTLADRDAAPPEGFGPTTSPRDFANHGTAMAGIIGAIADNDTALAGIAYRNPMWIFKIGQKEYPEIKPSEVLTALGVLADSLAAQTSTRFVVNMSFHFDYVDLNEDARACFDSVLTSLEETDRCLVVAATGNEFEALWAKGKSGPECEEPGTFDLRVRFPAAFSSAYPYSHPGVIAVGASRLAVNGTTEFGYCHCDGFDATSAVAWAEYSCYQPLTQDQPECTPAVDLVAPGGAREDVFSESPCPRMNVYAPELSNPDNPDGAPLYPAHIESKAGTSNSAAIVTGVLTGAWSKNPTLTPGQLKLLAKAYTDRFPFDMADGSVTGPLHLVPRSWCLQPPSPPYPFELEVASLSPEDNQIVDTTGKVGAGVLNAGRVIAHVEDTLVDYLTGGVLSGSLSFSSSDVVVLADTLIVEEGATLTLGRSTGHTQNLLVEQGVHGRPVLLVEGELQLGGDLIMQSYHRDDVADAWHGVVLTGSGRLVMNGHTLTIRNATTALTVTADSTAFDGDVETALCGTGVEVVGILDVSGSVTVSDCGTGLLLTGSNTSATFGGVSVTAATDWGVVVGAGVEAEFGSLSLAGCAEAGMIAQEARVEITGSASVQDGAGIRLEDALQGTIVTAATFTNTTGVALDVEGGAATIGPDVAVDGSGASASGIRVHNATVTISSSVTVTNAGLHGLELDGVMLNGDLRGVECTQSGSDGLHASTCSGMAIEDGAFSNNEGVGIYLAGTNASIDSTIADANVIGVSIEGTAQVDVTWCQVRSNSVGVSVGEDAVVDLGQSLGKNDFSSTATKYVMNFNQSETVQAVGNYWGACPPSSKKFYGGVNYASCLASPPQ